MADSASNGESSICFPGNILLSSSKNLSDPNVPMAQKDDETERVCEIFSSINFCTQEDLTVECRVSDQVPTSKSQVLRQPSYESNNESDEDSDEVGPQIILEKSPSEDFPRIEIIRNGRAPNTLEQQNSDKTKTSSASSYYFIDASTLNDDLDIATTNIVSHPNDLNGHTTWSSTHVPNSYYIPTSNSNRMFFTNDSPDQNSAGAQKECNARKHMANESSLLEHREVGKLCEITMQSDSLNCAGISKESLAVEIKEADSGDSAQLSPCPDNTKVNNIDRVQDKLLITDLDNQEYKSLEKERQTDEKVENEEKNESDEERKPQLIRRNTFELDANDEKITCLRQEYERQEYERRQGSLVFQNSITQYSQHLIDDDPYFDEPTLTGDVEPSFQPKVDFVLDKYKLDSSEREELPVESIAKSPSDRLLLANCAPEEALGFASLPIGLNDEPKSRLRRNEAAPIVSGGVSSEDFQRRVDSPSVRRKTESTPILSGGSQVTRESPPQPRKPSPGISASSTAAWVVDMSDCGQRPKTANRSSRESGDSRHSSLGYFVNLEDVESPRVPEVSRHRRRPSEPGVTEKTYCEFFVDLKSAPRPEAAKTPMSSSQPSEPATGSKKNIFSMFIDLSEPSAAVGRAAGISKSSSSSKLVDRRSEQKDLSTPTSERKPRSGVFMFIESDSPVVRRRTMSSSRGTFKRHSWNMDKSTEEQPTPTVAEPQPQPQPQQQQQQQQQQTLAFKRLHKRAHSLSVDRSGDLRKFLASRSSGESSHSLNESTDRVSQQQTQEQQQAEKEDSEETLTRFDYEVRDTPPNSHVEILDEELLASLKARHYQELDAINEQTTSERKEAEDGEEQRTTGCSETNSLWEKTTTVTESTETNRSRKSETFDIASSGTSTSTTSELSSGGHNLDSKLNELLDATQRKLAITTRTGGGREDNRNEKLGKTSNIVVGTLPASFVRLSDLDKRPLSNSAKLVPASRENPAARLSSSVIETSWIESKLMVSASRTSDSLRRPLVKTLPINVLAGISKSENIHDLYGEGEHEGTFSESDISSLQSSMARSGQGSTEETETSTSFALGKPHNRLGEDLLRMFLEEINPDVTIDVAGQRIRAHKCILSSRCQYFAAILSGDWVENTGNIISLQGYSYNAVHFALCHIYSGESCIPDSISIVELATLADMLCLEGLKEVIGFTLKVKYCHLFHKPCNGCVVGVLECMPLAAAYGLDEVYRKSLRWITRHFVRIWPTKEFATLPRELMEKCYHQHIAYMSIDNVLQSIMDCDKLLTTLPNVRWAESVFRLVSNLLDASMKYLTDNFASVLGNENFQGLDRDSTWNISRLEENLIAAAGRLSPEQACKSYSKLDKIMGCAYVDDNQRLKLKSSNPLFFDLMVKIREQVEKCLIRDAARAARTNAWLKMDLELRRRVQELACLVIMPNEASNNNKRMSRHSNFTKALSEHFEPASAKIPASRTPPSRSSDLRKVKMAMSEHNERTQQKQTPLLQTRKLMNKPKTDPLERKSQVDKLSSDVSNALKPKTWPNKIEVKSRYLEPRSRFQGKESSVAQPQPEKLLGQQRKKIMISSSDSSRTSSPAMKRAAEKKALSGRVTKVPMKKDGKALSSDSLADSSSRLANTAKKDPASKSCGMTRPESPLSRTTTREGLSSVESLARKNQLGTKILHRTDASMSTDSLATDATAITSPRSVGTNKSSPVLGKSMVPKKASPLMQQRTGVPTATRRPARSLESSTAASRSRAAAVAAVNGSMSLRKSLLDAAKAPDVSNRSSFNSSATSRSSLRQPSTFSNRTVSKVKKDEPTTGNQRPGSGQAGSKRSPNLNGNVGRLTRSNITANKQRTNKTVEKSSNKNKSQSTTAAAENRDGPKFLNQSSRSGTFLKDEPTILNKSDIQTAAIDV